MSSWQDKWTQAVGSALRVMNLSLPVWRFSDSDVKTEQVIVT
jgi:hypothetical protein